MMNFGNNDDDDFGANPFRSSNSNDFLGSPNPPPQAAPAMNMNINPAMNMNYNQPDPYSGMTGSLDMTSSPPQQQMQMPPPLPPQQQQAHPMSPDPANWSGAMDSRAAAVENYGGTSATRNGQAVQAAPFNFFSWSSWVACCRVEAYQKYFDFDTADISERLKASLIKFHEPDQFRTVVVGDFPTETLKGPDLYGPVWIVMTLVFVLAATSNIYAFWEHHRKKADPNETDVEEFEVDIKHLLRACNVVLFFVFGMSSAFWLAASCMGMPGISWGLWVCIYGYSQMPFMVAAILCCIFPMPALTWLLILMAGTASTLLVVRNLSTPLMGQDDAGNKKSAPVITAMLVVHLIYIFVIKYTFFD